MTATLISQADMVQKLKTVKGATMISLIAETIPKLKKTGNNLGEVKKVAYVNGVLNYNYEGSVNRQRKREGKTDDFKAEKRTWGERDGALVERTTKAGTDHYLQFKLERVIDTKYVGAGGGILSDAVVGAFLMGKKKSDSQKVDKDIIMLNYKLTNIKQIKMNGETYILT